MTRESAARILDSFEGKKLLVIGDLMLDKYVRGQIERMSPEAPVPVVRVTSESFSLGGAANVVHNLRALGATCVVVGRVGTDAEGATLLKLLHNQHVATSGIVQDQALPTTLKTRVIAHHQHVVRVDREECTEADGQTLERMLKYVDAHIADVDGVIVSDYGKGVVTHTLMRQVVSMARLHEKLVVVDPKSPDIDRYRGVSCITPNLKEAGEALGEVLETDEDVARCGRWLLEALEAECVLITRGERGMTLFLPWETAHLPAHVREVYDLSGAGDTVVSAFALALCAGAVWGEAAQLANIAAGVVVGKLGTASASRKEILRQLAEV